MCCNMNHAHFLCTVWYYYALSKHCVISVLGVTEEGYVKTYYRLHKRFKCNLQNYLDRATERSRYMTKPLNCFETTFQKFKLCAVIVAKSFPLVYKFPQMDVATKITILFAPNKKYRVGLTIARNFYVLRLLTDFHFSWSQEIEK